MIDNKYFFELQMHMIFLFTNFESEGALLNNISCYTFWIILDTTFLYLFK